MRFRMKSLTLILALMLASLTCSATPPAATSSAEIIQRQSAAIINTLTTSQAEVRGDFHVDRDVPLMSDRVRGILPVNLTLQRNQDILFTVSERDVMMTSRMALKLNVGGVDFYINNINFDERNGFSVRMDSPLWWNIGGQEVADEVKKSLEQRFGAKMRRALRELRTLRQQRNLKDANRVMAQIQGIFQENNPDTRAPNFQNVSITGNLGITITSTQQRNFDLGEAQLQVVPGSTLSADSSFRLRNNSLTITELSFSADRINVFPTGENPNGVVRVTGGRITLSPRGLESIFDTPAETEVIQVTAVIAWLGGVMATGNAATGIICPPGTRVQFIQDMISERVRPQLTAMIREHRAEFLRAGIDPQILNALD